MTKRIETKEEAQKFIENGGKCFYRYGWAYRGAPARLMTKEDAMNQLPKFNFGMGFYELKWTHTSTGEEALEFNELRENDMW